MLREGHQKERSCLRQQQGRDNLSDQEKRCRKKIDRLAENPT